jgi:hypothetical protein
VSGAALSYDLIADLLVELAVAEPRIRALWAEADNRAALRRPYTGLEIHLAADDPDFPALVSELPSLLGQRFAVEAVRTSETERLAKQFDLCFHPPLPPSFHPPPPPEGGYQAAAERGLHRAEDGPMGQRRRGSPPLPPSFHPPLPPCSHPPLPPEGGYQAAAGGGLHRAEDGPMVERPAGSLPLRIIAERTALLAKRPRAHVVALADKTGHLTHVMDFSRRR